MPSGGSVTVSWSGVVNPTATDWIGVYSPINAAGSAYVIWFYTDNCTKTAGSGKLASGSCSFVMPTTLGTYQFRLFTNNGYTVLATSATVTVTKASPSLTTTASATVPAGGSIKDTATLAGGSSPTGTITFRLYGPTDPTCTGAPVATSAATVSGAGSYASAAFTPTTVGTYEWIASYGGDSLNTAATGVCDATGESVTVTKASPTLSTAASGSVSVGGMVKDTATLAGGSSPVGTITFKLYGPSDPTCMSAPVATSTAIVVGNGPYSSSGTVAPSVGTFHWVASYGGDSNNIAVAGTCGAAGESVTVTATPPPPPPPPTLTTSVTTVAAGGQITVKWSGIANPAPTTTDWVALYSPGAASTAYLNWFYTDSCTRTAGSNIVGSGSCAFTMPSMPGPYQFRLFSNNGYTLLATSATVTIPPPAPPH